MHVRNRPTPAPAALLIDGMGTLVHLEDPVAALQGELAGLGIEVTAAQARTALGAEIAHYRAHMLRGSDGDRLAALRADCAAVLWDALPAQVARQEITPEAMTGVLLGALRFAAYPDARPALLAARRRGVRVVVVSNWDVSLAEVLERCGLAPLLDAVVTSAAVGAAKPAPEIFAHALALAGVAGERALHVGDSVAEDVAGAVACDITPVLVRRDDAAPPPPAGVTVVRTLTEVDALWSDAHATTFPTDP